MSLVGQPCQLPVFLALAGSELTGWSMRRKLGTVLSSFTVAMCFPNPYQRLFHHLDCFVAPLLTRRNRPLCRGPAPITPAAATPTVSSRGGSAARRPVVNSQWRPLCRLKPQCHCERSEAIFWEVTGLSRS